MHWGEVDVDNSIFKNKTDFLMKTANDCLLRTLATVMSITAPTVGCSNTSCMVHSTVYYD